VNTRGCFSRGWGMADSIGRYYLGLRFFVVRTLPVRTTLPGCRFASATGSKAAGHAKAAGNVVVLLSNQLLPREHVDPLLRVTIG
jgi:hypothetical protein